MIKTSYLKRTGEIMLFAAMLGACEVEDSEFEKQRKLDDEMIKNYLSANEISATKDESGIYYEVLHENPGGEPVTGNDIVSIFYAIKTLEGEQLEKTTDSLAPVRFVHDFKSIVPLGLDYAVHLMKQGDKYRFYIPSVLAFDKYQRPGDLEPNTNFITDVEVVALSTENEIDQWEKDSIQNYIEKSQLQGLQSFPSGLFYKRLEAGEGATPSSYSTVKFHFKRSYLDSTIIEETAANAPVTIPLNRGYAVKGLEEGLMHMEKGEKALLIMPSKIAFGSSIQILPLYMRDMLINDQVLQTKVQPFSPVVYEVELLDFY